MPRTLLCRPILSDALRRSEVHLSTVVGLCFLCERKRVLQTAAGLRGSCVMVPVVLRGNDGKAGEMGAREGKGRGGGSLDGK